MRTQRSLDNARQFYALAKEEFSSDDVMQQRDGCEKAYRAATEAVDVLLARYGFDIPAGQPEAHQERRDALMDVREMLPEADELRRQYNDYLTVLHGGCFYGQSDPKKYTVIFDEVETFISKIADLLA